MNRFGWRTNRRYLLHAPQLGNESGTRKNGAMNSGDAGLPARHAFAKTYGRRRASRFRTVIPQIINDLNPIVRSAKAMEVRFEFSANVETFINRWRKNKTRPSNTCSTWTQRRSPGGNRSAAHQGTRPLAGELRCDLRAKCWLYRAYEYGHIWKFKKEPARPLGYPREEASAGRMAYPRIQDHRRPGSFQFLHPAGNRAVPGSDRQTPGHTLGRPGRLGTQAGLWRGTARSLSLLRSPAATTTKPPAAGSDSRSQAVTGLCPRGSATDNDGIREQGVSIEASRASQPLQPESPALPGGSDRTIVVSSLPH